MKKLFIVSLMVLSLVFAGSAMAVTPQPKDGPGIYQHSVTGKTHYFNEHPGEPSQWRLVDPGVCVECSDGETVTGTYSVLPMDWDWSKSISNHGYGNDYGFAKGQYGIGGDMDTFADAEGQTCKKVYMGNIYGWGRLNPRNYRTDRVDNEAFQTGTIFAVNKTKAFSWAKDYGLTSKAGAGIKADEGFVVITGIVEGKGGQSEFITSRITYGADFYQTNIAKEVGYSAGDVVAGNSSGLNFRGATDWTTYTIFGGHLNGESFTPDIKTVGKSEVTIDPYGDYRSIVAHTENFSRINLDAGRCDPNIYINQANVYGSGFVAGQISNGGAFAGGRATFDYTGYTNGSGQADLNAYVSTQGQSTVGFVSGSSSSVANSGKVLD